MALDAVHSILADALELPRHERSDFVRRRCGGDEELEREILDLLAADDEDLSLMDHPLVDRAVGAEGTGDPGVTSRPETVGPYRVLREIGSGGMGIVYEAEQQEPVRRRVALKVIKPGMDSREVARRFEMERQTLFSLEHPDIARAYDAGTSERGRLFFAMELVDGEPIDRYCDGHQLDLEQRLRLFARTCLAVQYAHLRGVIHRDLKPSNVLVCDSEQGPVPKVIDFGIAKALHPEAGPDDPAASAITRQAQPIGTPETMSPEQARGDAVDIRTDVYSAGALLYRLICGAGPFSEETPRSSDWMSMQRLILEHTPTAPRSLARRRNRTPPGVDLGRLQSARELDWIVQRALAKEPERRYQSMEQLAMDVERFLRHEAVAAGPERWTYRAQKFVRRHRTAVATTAAVLGLLLLGSIALAIQANRLRLALGVAERERAQAEQVTDLIGSVLAGADPKTEGRRDVTALELLDRGEPKVRTTLAGQPDVLSELLRVMADVRHNLGDDDTARRLYEEVAALERAGDDPGDLSRALNGLALVHDTQSRFEEAEQAARGALDAARDADDPGLEVAALQNVGWALVRQGALEEGEQLLDEAVGLAGAHPEVRRDLRRDVRRMQATVWTRLGRSEQALAQMQALLAEEVEEPTTPTYATLLRSAMGAMLIDLGRSDQALPLLEQALSAEGNLLGSAHPQTMVTRANIALAANNIGDVELARDMNLESLRILEETRPGPHGSKALLFNNLGLNQHGLGDLDAAEDSFRRAIEIQRAVVGDDHPNLAFHLSNLARVLQETGRPDEAEAAYREAMDLRDRHLTPDHPARADTEIWLGAFLHENGRTEEALRHLRRGVAIREAKLDPDGWQIAEARSWLGAALVAAGEVDEGLPLVVDAYPVIRNQRGDHWQRTAPALERVIRAQEAAGHVDEAAAARRLYADRYTEVDD